VGVVMILASLLVRLKSNTFAANELLPAELNAYAILG
jgi:hypothetical protein